MQGIQQFEKYKILLAEAKANGDTSRVNALEDLLQSIDLGKIEDESETMVNGFRDGLNRM